MKIHRVAAFSLEGQGCNPAGVFVGDQLPSAADMQARAKEVGYSEIVFSTRTDDGWRTRYFAPEMEVPFCGHATIGLGATLTKLHGAGTYPLVLNETQISVQGTEVAGCRYGVPISNLCPDFRCAGGLHCNIWRNKGNLSNFLT